MQRGLLRAALALSGVSVAALFAPCHAETAYPYEGRQNYMLDGYVRLVDTDRQRVTVAADDGSRYVVDTYRSDILLRGTSRAGSTADLLRGERVHVIGTLLPQGLLEADRVRVLPPGDPDTAPPAVADPPAATSQPASSDPPPAVKAGDLAFDGIVRRVDPDHDRLIVVDNDDNHFTVDTYQSDILLHDAGASGHTGDLARGMKVHIIGTMLPRGVLVADRVRVLSATASLASDTVTLPAEPLRVTRTADLDPPRSRPIEILPAPAPPVASVVEPLENYTGILIDVRGLHDIQRSPAPAIYGADGALLYPDRSHVPTPDEVQEQSIVRYYRTEEAAEAGVCGSHPLILEAQAVVDYGHDAVQLSPDDSALFTALDKRLHYLHTWKVGFLIPGDR